MKVFLVVLVALLAVSAVHAEKWAIHAQYYSTSCDQNKISLFTSTPESNCHYDAGGSFYFWNCSDANAYPQRMVCSDNKCTVCKVNTGPPLTNECKAYVLPGVYYNAFCADKENPFPTNLKIKLTRRYYNTTDCQQQRNLTQTVGSSFGTNGTSIFVCCQPLTDVRSHPQSA